MSERNLETAKKARALLAKGYCKTHVALDARGQPISTFYNGEPVAFCAFGALFFVSKPYTLHATKLCEAISEFVPNVAQWGGLVTFSDDPATTHQEVLKVFDDYIASLET